MLSATNQLSTNLSSRRHFDNFFLMYNHLYDMLYAMGFGKSSWLKTFYYLRTCKTGLNKKDRNHLTWLLHRISVRFFNTPQMQSVYK